MLSFNFKRSHPGGGGNTAGFDFLFGFWLGGLEGCQKWVLLLSTWQNHILLSVEKGGKLKSSGNSGYVPRGRHNHWDPSTQLTPIRPGVRKLKIFAKGGATGEMGSGNICTEHYAAPRAEHGLHPYVLPFECLWARHSPSLASPVEWGEEWLFCSPNRTENGHRC